MEIIMEAIAIEIKTAFKVNKEFIFLVRKLNVSRLIVNDGIDIINPYPIANKMNPKIPESNSKFIAVLKKVTAPNNIGPIRMVEPQT
jgi:hypothetical protein